MDLTSLAVGLSAALLLLLAAFYRMTRVRPSTPDLEFAERQNLYAVYVLKILESADYQFHARRSREYRDFLFHSYARNLERDVRELTEQRPGLLPLLFRWLYRLIYGLLRLKRCLRSNIGDLRLLLGIVLALVRHLAR